MENDILLIDSDQYVKSVMASQVTTPCVSTTSCTTADRKRQLPEDDAAFNTTKKKKQEPEGN